ncbi:bifunctional 3-dehydroquinate dehydratase/shikimate dehydrogenase, chloroplastic-like [Gossypium australe]|uniref:Bifunctional 3-dehydroquinate dehydratase/shikimate dehydrogenase, chloroplastic-like n=1 Tax=Gossypium australe TaxID=47621 RepID=A0A5B6W0D1_9ROSI|nr:bifunctional 3-dehydroquinate dehydratase/shikimate dehydrogenase, chloroplastic-like [Gossypium australe]
MDVKNDVVVCIPLECESLEEMVASMEKAKAEGADVVELCIASMAAPYHSHQVVDQLLERKTLPAIVSFRLKSSRTLSKGGCYDICLKVLKRELELDVEFVEMDYEVACEVNMAEYLHNRLNTRIIVSNYVNDGRPSVEKLVDIIACIFSTNLYSSYSLSGAIDCYGSWQQWSDKPTYMDLSEENQSLDCLLLSVLDKFISSNIQMRIRKFSASSRIQLIIVKALFFTTLPSDIWDIMEFTFLCLLMIEEFFETYSGSDFAGFSVGIPHKKAAIRCYDEVHPIAKSIGAVNTIPMDGKLIGYNTDGEAAISAIEDALTERKVSSKGVPHSTSSLISGRTFVLIGAGGAGRALAFGAKYKGARIVIFNRNYKRAKALADEVSGEALLFEALETFRPETGAILANASAIGMEPNSHQSAVSKEALRAYDLVFDVVYTPRNTQLLKEVQRSESLL